MQLKDYQIKLLDAYSGFLRAARVDGAKAAYQESVREWRELVSDPPYYPLPNAEEVPYVCLRVPTGGGKTFLAAHSIDVFQRDYRPADKTLTLWLVPSEAIRSQTLRILKDRDHPLTRSLRAAVGSIEVLDVTEALYITPSTLDTNQTIIAATMQSFKREDSSGLRVHKENGQLMDHFSRKGINNEQIGNHSLIDVIRLHRPFVIVDEAHNQGTKLAIDTLVDFSPSAVLELTATPDRNHTPSNVLRSISASVLQAEDMLKLPLELSVSADWRKVLTASLARRSQLDEDAKKEQTATGEVIRPVLFIQAEKAHKGHETMVPERVKETLITDFKITENDIAICTGKLDEIGDRQMENPDFPRIIITVDKLREGWDCPFAYVLMTFRNTTSKVAVEQVVGRVLRMPHVKRKQHESLNRAYCYACSSDFGEVLSSLKDGLVESGFERYDTNNLFVIPDEQSNDDLFDAHQETKIDLPVIEGEFRAPDLSGFSKTALEKIELNPESGTLTLIGKPSPKLQKDLVTEIEKAAGESAGQDFKLRMDELLSSQVNNRPRDSYPSRQGKTLVVPRLMFRQGDFLDEFEQSVLLDTEWTLEKDCDFTLEERHFSLKPEMLRHYQLDVEHGKVTSKFYEQQELSFALQSREQGWDIVSLTHWLDYEVDFPYADQSDKVAWIRRALEELMKNHDLEISDLAYRKFRLREAIRRKLEEELKMIQLRNFQNFFENEEAFEVPGGEHAISFTEGHYGYNTAYAGSYQFHKHFFPQIGDLKDKGEEFECARRIDEHPDVEYWVRNVEKQKGAFYLSTSRGRFYPDFVIKLKSGKVIVIEYKGEKLAQADSEKEKNDIGELWQRRSKDNCEFGMIVNKAWQELDKKLSA